MNPTTSFSAAPVANTVIEFETEERGVDDAVQETLGRGRDPMPRPHQKPHETHHRQDPRRMRQEKARFERARAEADRMQSSNTVVRVSNTPITSPSTTTKTSSPLKIPPRITRTPLLRITKPPQMHRRIRPAVRHLIPPRSRTFRGRRVQRRKTPSRSL
ncbi:hypothetical protein C8J56DRAFT_390983 [Mycena floridula]|nr:hypothetical protein C8J56DRAFT_390983 [Mycena floridula]